MRLGQEIGGLFGRGCRDGWVRGTGEFLDDTRTSMPATAALRTSAVTNVSVEADFAESWTVLSDLDVQSIHKSGSKRELKELNAHCLQQPTNR